MASDEFFPPPSPAASPEAVDRARTELVRRLKALDNARHELRQLIDAFSLTATVEEQSLNDDLQDRYQRSFRDAGGC